MTDRELMQQALEALEMWCKGPHDSATRRGANTRSSVAITALRERLAQPEQGPVAGEYATCLEDGERVLIASVLPVGYGGNKTRTVRVVWPDGMDGVYTMFQFARLFSPVGERATPPRREWQGLAADSTIQTVPAQGGLLPTMKEGKDFTISKPWVGLTLEEIGLLTTGDGWSHLETPALALFARAIEAKLKEKNA